MPEAEVVVTGVGMVTPLGATAAESWAAWRAGRSAARRRLPELAGTPLEAMEAAGLPELDPAGRLGGRRMLKYMSEAAVLGCLAAHEAAEAAGLRARFRPERVGLYAGTGLAAAGVEDVRPMLQASIAADGEFSCRLLGERGLAAANPLLSFKILANMPPCLVSIIEGVKGPNYIFAPWEGQTAAALLEARDAVASGEADAALCGAADNAAHPATLTYLVQSGRLAAGEFPAAAAAYLVLERAATARRDGRRILARIAGMSLEPLDSARGLERAKRAERPAGAAPADPLAARMGRSFAAAPAVLVALGCQAADGAVELTGAEGETFRAELRACP